VVYVTNNGERFDMKKWMISCLLAAALGSLWSQNVVVSDPIDLDNRTQYSIVGTFPQKILLYQETGADVSMAAFDYNLQLLWNRPLEKQTFDSRTIAVVDGEDEFYWFYSLRQRDSVYIQKRTYDLNASLVSTETILKLTDVAPAFMNDLSFDRSKILFFQPIRNEEVMAAAYDLNLQKIVFQTRFAIEGKFSNAFKALTITNKGELYMLFDLENQRYDRDEHVFSIYYFRPEMKSPVFNQIPFYGYLTNSLTIRYDEFNEKLNLAGYYTQRNLSRTEGLFVFDYRPTDTATAIVQYEWPEEIKKALYGPQGASEVGIEDLVAQEIILRDDGGIVLVGEIEKIYERRATYAERGVYARGSNWVDFIYEDVIAASINPDGSWAWSRVLHKRQFSQDDGAIFSSFFLFHVPSFFRIIYNDEIGSNATASAYEVFTSGESSRSSILSTQFQKLKLRFQEAFQYSSTEILVPSEYRGELKLVKIQF